MACEGRAVLPSTFAQMQGCVPSNSSVKTLVDEWADGWTDRHMTLERDREGLQTWKTLLALLSGDSMVEPHHRLCHCAFTIPHPPFLFPYLAGRKWKYKKQI